MEACVRESRGRVHHRSLPHSRGKSFRICQSALDNLSTSGSTCCNGILETEKLIIGMEFCILYNNRNGSVKIELFVSAAF